MSHSSRSVVAVFLALTACTDSRLAGPIESPSVQALAARLDLTDADAVPGSDVLVSVRLVGPMSSSVASVTARITYDTTGLRFVDEEMPADGVTRALNPVPGALRLAAVAPLGFASGQLDVIRLRVLRAGAPATLRLVVDELHTTRRTDAKSALMLRGR